MNEINETLSASSALDEIGQNYKNQILSRSQDLGFNDKAKRVLTVAGTGAGAAALVLLPSIVDGMSAQGLDLPQAIVYAINSQITGGTAQRMDPEITKEFLKTLGETGPGQAISVLGKEIARYATEARYTLYNIGVLTAVVAGVNRLSTRGEKIKQEIFSGMRIIKRDGEQLFVIGGNSSNIADALTLANPEQTLPIFENQKGGAYILSKLQKIVKRERGVFINLNVGEGPTTSYRKSDAWGKIIIKEGNLITSKKGVKYLVTVGCGEVAEEELSQRSNDTDVTQEELHTSTEKLKERISRLSSSEVQTVKIHIGSAKTSRINPDTGEPTATDRELAARSGIDIYVDNWALFIKGITNNTKTMHMQENGIRLVSSVPEYRQLMEGVAKDAGTPLVAFTDDETKKPTLIIYERNSDDTLNAARRLKEKHPDRNIIALTSNVEAHDQATKDGITSICSALNAASAVEYAVKLLRDGKEPKEIQEILDQHVQSEIQ